MTFVTDTHALVHRLTGQNRRLGRRAHRVFERAERGLDRILIPFTVLQEIMLLSETGRIRLPVPFRELLVSLMRSENIDLGSNDPDLLLEASALTGIRDPYDRLIVAQARMTPAPLITADEKIHASRLVQTVWD
jgi:PIN domain nuclease of toxin-antitoxin system